MQRAEHDRRRDAQRDVAAFVGSSLSEARERLAVDVLQDDEDLARVDDDVERRHDVRVAHARGEPRFVDEHRDELRVRRELRVEPLDRDGAREPDRADDAPEVDRRHAAGRDLPADRVAADDSIRATAHE